MYSKGKKKAGKIIGIAVAFVLVLAAAIGLLSTSKQDSSEEEIVLESNQALKQVKIQAIYGNEINGTLIEGDTESQELQTWVIPVGTEVVTKLGTTTTFSRLANGDQIQLLTQTLEDGSETILKVWITE